MSWKIEGNKLIIELNTDSKELSRSGKSYMLASSGGFQYTGNIGVNFNVIRKKD